MLRSQNNIEKLVTISHARHVAGLHIAMFQDSTNIGLDFNFEMRDLIFGPFS